MQTHDSLTGEDARQWKRYRIMKEMGWSYGEYESTPSFILDQIWVFMATEEVYLEQLRSEHG